MLRQFDRHPFHATTTWFNDIRAGAVELVVAVAPEVKLRARVARLVLEHLRSPMVLLSIVPTEGVHDHGRVQHPGGGAERSYCNEAYNYRLSRCPVSQVTTQERNDYCCGAGCDPPTGTTNRHGGVLSCG